MKTRKILALLLVAALTLCLFAGCGKTAETQTATEPAVTDTAKTDTSAAKVETSENATIIDSTDAGEDKAELGVTETDETLIVTLPTEPAHLSLLYGNAGETTSYVWSNMADTLFTMDIETGEYLPRVAESYEWIDDQHLKITIRPGVTMYDGSEYTANDLVWTIKMGQSYTNVTNYTMYDLENTVVEDDYNIILAYNTPYRAYAFGKIVAETMVPVIDESSCEALGGFENCLKNPNYVGGRYFLKEWVDGEYILLERNENYWDTEDICYFKYIKFNFVEDAATRAMAVQSGQSDVACALTVAQYESVADAEGITVLLVDTGSSRAFWFNNSKAPFDNILVRKAICKLIDTDVIANIATGGLGSSIDNLVLSSFDFYDPNITSDWDGTVDEAKALLAEAGYDESNPLEFDVISNATDVTTLEAIQAMLLQAGVTMNINTLDFGALMNAMCAGDYQANISTGAFNSAATWMYTQQLDGRLDVGIKYGGPQVNDEALYEPLDVLQVSSDPDELQEAWSFIQQYLADNYLGLPLYNNFMIDITKDNLAGASFYATGELRPYTIYKVQ